MRNILAIVLLAATVGSTSMSAQVTANEAIAQMKKGINMGNTLEPPLEGGWNNGPAQEYLFDIYQEAGFDFVRVPVRWDKHTGTTPPYAVDATWMDHVEEVLDWGLERGMYVVVNSHHDHWIKEDYENAALRARFDSIWVQIAAHFKDKSDRLIFEICNEPEGLTKAQSSELHLRVYNLIRETNPTRMVMFQGPPWGSSEGLMDSEIPDPGNPYLIGSFHSYDPWPFGLEGTGSFGSDYDINKLDNKFNGVKTWSDGNNIPIFLGEFGCNKDADYISRMTHYSTYGRLCEKYGFAPCTWDDGGKFWMLQRVEHYWNETFDYYMFGSVSSPDKPTTKLYNDSIIWLSWTNMITDNDEIVIQRRTAGTEYEDIATLDPSESSFHDEDLPQDETYYYRVIAKYSGGDMYYSYPAMILLPVYVPDTRGPFLGTARAIPGTVEAEDFDEGGDGVAYHDVDDWIVPGDYRTNVGVDIYDMNGEGFIIGNFSPGEWCEYTVDVEESADYKVIAHMATFLGGGTLEIEFGELSSGAMVAPTTNNLIITDTVSTVMSLEEGEQIMRVTCLAEPSYNFDKVEFELIAEDPDGIVGSLAEQMKLKVYQDQSRDVIIEFDQNTALQMINVYSITGRLLYSSDDPMTDQYLPSSLFRQGLYIISARSAAGLVTKKFLFNE